MTQEQRWVQKPGSNKKYEYNDDNDYNSNERYQIPLSFKPKERGGVGVIRNGE